VIKDTSAQHFILTSSATSCRDQRCRLSHSDLQRDLHYHSSSAGIGTVLPRRPSPPVMSVIFRHSVFLQCFISYIIRLKLQPPFLDFSIQIFSGLKYRGTLHIFHCCSAPTSASVRLLVILCKELRCDPLLLG
jgi:hypothetical protein